MSYNELLSSKLSILVVESDERVLKRLSIWIKAISNEIFVTPSPLEALDIVQNNNIDIVLFNSKLNFMGSMEFLEKVKQINAQQVSVAMIDEIDIELFKKSISLGVDKYLNQPVDAKILIQVIEDLAHEKVFQQEFRKQNKILQEYKEAIDKSFVVSKHTIDGSIDLVNEAFCALFNLSQNDDESFNPLFDEEGNKEREIWDILENNKIFRGRKEYKRSGSEDIIVDLTVVPILNDSNQVEEYIAFISDVSELVFSGKKLTEEKMQRLIQEKSHNEEMSKVKDSFLTVFTHELRTPLNAIINFSQHTKKQISKVEIDKKESIESELSAIYNSGVSMLDMINNVMDAIKLRDKTIRFTHSEFSLGQTLQSVIDRLQYLVEEQNINLNVINACSIISDHERVTQLFLNLISNALKYSKGEVKVFVKSNESKFGVVIEDNGPGISREAKVFELFEQLSEDEMTRTASGVGVGLYIVKQLCDSFGYNMTIDTSAKLGGAKITITGPLKAKYE